MERKNKAIVMGGNPNLKAIESVLYLYNKKFHKLIKTVYFIDIPKSTIDKDGNSIYNKRTRLTQEYLGMDVEIRVKMTNEENLAIILPEIFANLLDQFSIDDIIVDLTNGTKIVSSYLYGIASLCRCKSIYYLYLQEKYHKIKLRSLKRKNMILLNVLHWIKLGL